MVLCCHCVKSSVFSVDSISVLEIPEAQGLEECEDCADKKLCDIPQNSLGQSSTSFFVLLAFAIPLAIICVLYTKVAHLLHHRSNSGMMHKMAARSKFKAVRMLVITVFGYVLSLGPLLFSPCLGHMALSTIPRLTLCFWLIGRLILLYTQVPWQTL